MKWFTTLLFFVLASFRSFSAIPTPPNTALLNFSASLPQASPLQDSATNTFTFFLNNTTGVVWDVNLTTFIEHPRPSDLEIYLISPQGTPITLITRSDSTNSNLFNNLLWDDQALVPITDYVVTNGTSLTSLVPEGSLDACFGENPQGTWQLAIIDKKAGFSGTCSNAVLSITTLVGETYTRAITFLSTNSVPSTNNTSLLTNLTTNIFTLDVTNTGQYLACLKTHTWLKHPFASDLDIFLTSPEGTTITLTTDNGGNKADVFNGTLWDDKATTLATDATYTNALTQAVLVPEGALSAFRGENPNGTWTLQIVDDTDLDEGTLDSWSLIVDALPEFIGDVTGDGFTDIVTAKKRKIYVLQMINEAPQGASFAGLIPKKNRAVGINEFTGDQQADLLVQQGNFLAVLAFSNSFLVSNYITLSGDVIRPNYKVVATTDLNQDGLIDIISQNKSELGVTLAQKDNGVVSYQFKSLALGQTGKIVGVDRTNLLQRVKTTLYSIPVINDGSNSFRLGDPSILSPAFRPSFKISGVAELAPLNLGRELIIQRGSIIGYGPTNISRTIQTLYKGQGQGNLGRIVGPR